MSAVIANSSTLYPSVSITCFAWDPSLIIFSNKAPSLAYWNLPNTSSNACCCSNSPRVDNASANPVTVFIKSPLFAWIIASKLTPNLPSVAVADLLGLIKDAKPDFNAFAPCSALTPPSCIAAKNTVKSFTLPPNPSITGATRGIAAAISCRLTTVWFSTMFKKLIVFANSSPESLNALWSAIVVSNAAFWSIWPSVASLVDCATASVKSEFCLPAAAACAARLIVSFTAMPYFVYSLAKSCTAFKFCCNSFGVVNKSPYTFLNATVCFSKSANTFPAVVPNIVNGTVKPTISCLPAHCTFLPKFISCVVPCLNIDERIWVLWEAIVAWSAKAWSGLIANASCIPFEDLPVATNCVWRTLAFCLAKSNVSANSAPFLTYLALKYCPRVAWPFLRVSSSAPAAVRILTVSAVNTLLELTISARLVEYFWDAANEAALFLFNDKKTELICCCKIFSSAAALPVLISMSTIPFTTSATIQSPHNLILRQYQILLFVLQNPVMTQCHLD